MGVFVGVLSGFWVKELPDDLKATYLARGQAEMQAFTSYVWNSNPQRLSFALYPYAVRYLFTPSLEWHKSRLHKLTVCNVSFSRSNDQVTISKSEYEKLLSQDSGGYNTSRNVLTVCFRKGLLSCHRYLHCPLSMG